MTKPYYILVCRNEGLEKPSNDADWLITFGDYDKHCVEYERDEAYSSLRKIDKKIVRLPDDKQSTIDEALDALNGRNPDLVETPIS